MAQNNIIVNAFNFIKGCFAPLETPVMVTATAPAFIGFSWMSSAAFDDNQVVTYHMASPNEGRGLGMETVTKRAKVGVAGGALVGPGVNPSTGKAMSPTLCGYAVAKDGDVNATVYGTPLSGHRNGDGLWVKFAIDAFVDDKLFTGLAKGLREATKAYGSYQLIVEVVHSSYGVGSQYAKAAAEFEGKYRAVTYHGIRTFIAPVKVVSVEVIVPGDERWVTVVVEGEDMTGVFGTKAEATPAQLKAKAKVQSANVAKLTKVFASFDELYTEVAPVVAKANELEVAGDKVLLDLDAVDDTEPMIEA